MKKLIIGFIAIYLAGVAYAASLTVSEVDGTPKVLNVRGIKVSNGTLTNNNNGQVSITTGGGGGSGDVTGGSSSVINGIALYSATTGKAIKGDPNLRMVSRSANSIYIGNGAGLNANGTTLQNTALGFGALTGGASFTGDTNTAIGYETGRLITTGGNNTMLGFQAGEGITTGTHNTAIGRNVLQSVNEFATSGSFNTCVGSGSFFGATTVTNGNTAVGYNTGVQSSFATASRNTLLGYQAGNNLTSGNNNIVIGYDIDTQSATGSNNLTIGNLIYGNGMTAIGTTVSGGKVGINKAQPAFTLDVNGTMFAKSQNFSRKATATSVSTSGETIIGVTSTAAARTITLATADMVAGRIVYIKDESGGAATNNITIDTQGAEVIDGVNSITITANYGVARLYSNGTNWFTL
jgi:hypothetical protein